MEWQVLLIGLWRRVIFGTSNHTMPVQLSKYSTANESKMCEGGGEGEKKLTIFLYTLSDTAFGQVNARS